MTLTLSAPKLLLSTIEENLMHNLLNPSINKIFFNFHTKYYARSHLVNTAKKIEAKSILKCFFPQPIT